MKRLMISLIVFSAMLNTAESQETNLASVLQPGEALQYKVRWKFLRLGTLYFTTRPDEQDSTKYFLSLTIVSNPSLPIIDIEEYNTSTIDYGSIYPLDYTGEWRSGKFVTKIRMEYEMDSRRARYSEHDGNTKSIIKETILTDIAPFVNGPTLFLFTRVHSDQVGNLDVPTLIGGDLKQTRLYFTPVVEHVDVDASALPIRCRKYFGKANWQGGTSAGLSGEFTGWISDDNAAVVVQAEMKVLLGSITLELEKYHRPGWTPPSGENLAKK